MTRVVHTPLRSRSGSGTHIRGRNLASHSPGLGSRLCRCAWVPGTLACVHGSYERELRCFRGSLGERGVARGPDSRSGHSPVHSRGGLGRADRPPRQADWPGREAGPRLCLGTVLPGPFFVSGLRPAAGSSSAGNRGFFHVSESTGCSHGIAERDAPPGRRHPGPDHLHQWNADKHDRARGALCSPTVAHDSPRLLSRTRRLHRLGSSQSNLPRIYRRRSLRRLRRSRLGDDIPPGAPRWIAGPDRAGLGLVFKQPARRPESLSPPSAPSQPSWPAMQPVPSSIGARPSSIRPGARPHLPECRNIAGRWAHDTRAPAAF